MDTNISFAPIRYTYILQIFELLEDACIANTGSGKKSNGLHLLHSPKDDYANVLEISQEEALWHRRFGHLNHRSLDFMAWTGKVDFSL